MRQEPPQLSLRAVLLGIVLSMLLAAANAYLGLFAGLTVSASIPAAVVSMAVLRWFRTSGVLENNIVQTAASAGEAIAAGAIFTLPALILMDYWVDFEYLWVVFLCGVGGLLGVLMTVPLRHALVDDAGLPFPEGQATAAVLKAGHGELDGDNGLNAGRAMQLLILGALVAAAAKLATAGFKLWQGVASVGVSAGGAVTYLGANLSPALLAVGYIVGLNVALLVFAGGVITWCVAVPVYAYLVGVDPAGDAATIAMGLWSSKLRFMGVGAMLVGGLWALWSMRGTLVSGMQRAVSRADMTQADLPRSVLLGLGASLAILMLLYYQHILQQLWVAVPLTLVMLIAAFLFSAVAAYMAGLVGSSNNPISGVTIATILLTALGLKFTLGAESAGMVGPVAVVLVGAVVCCAAAIGGDNLQDLKAGTLLGAAPWKQQIAQMIGVVSAVLVLAPVMSLLLHAYGIGVPDVEHSDPLPAPQATLMAAVAQGVFGQDLPWRMVAIGALIACGVIVIDEILRRRGSPVRAPVLAVAVGIYLPLKYSVPIALGGLVAYWAARNGGKKDSQLGVLLAAGLITGEALMGIALAVPIVMTGSQDALALGSPALAAAIGAWPAVILFFALCVWLGRIIPEQERS